MVNGHSRKLEPAKATRPMRAPASLLRKSPTPLGALRSVRIEIRGSHAVRGVQDNEDVQALSPNLLPHEPPWWVSQCDKHKSTRKKPEDGLRPRHYPQSLRGQPHHRLVVEKESEDILPAKFVWRIC